MNKNQLLIFMEKEEMNLLKCLVEIDLKTTFVITETRPVQVNMEVAIIQASAYNPLNIPTCLGVISLARTGARVITAHIILCPNSVNLNPSPTIHKFRMMFTRKKCLNLKIHPEAVTIILTSRLLRI